MESTILVKAMWLLEATAGAPEGRSLAELAEELTLTKPTAHRILKVLTTLGYVEREEGGIYRQTGRLRRLITPPDSRPLLDAAAPILRQLHQATCETVNLGVLRLGRIHYLDVIESTYPLRRVAQRFSQDPLHCTALGRAILSQLPPEQRRFHLKSYSLEARTPKTVVDYDALLEIIDKAAHDGFAVESDQTDLGVTCIAAPVLHAHEYNAAISISLPTVRAGADEQHELIQAVCRAARELGNSLSQPISTPVSSGEFTS